MKKKLIAVGVSLLGIGGAVLLMLGQPDIETLEVKSPPPFSSFQAPAGGGKLVYYRIGRGGEITVEELTLSAPVRLQGKVGKLRLAKDIQVRKREVRRYQGRRAKR